LSPSVTRFFLILLLLAVVSFALSLAIGSVSITPGQLWEILTEKPDDVLSQIVWQLRYPRTLTAFLTGCLLGLSGVLMQVLLRNPLADPFILGISGGAATGALLAILAGLTGYWVQGSAFSGAVISMLLVYLLSRTEGYNNPIYLLLTGVVLASGWGALINLLLILSDKNSTHAMLFWLMGDLSASQVAYEIGFFILAIALITSWLLARDLNLLIYGEYKAKTLGSKVGTVKNITFLLAAICTAIAVTMAGSIGFVGLIIPHLIRLIIGSDHRVLIPAATLAGGILVVLADLGARTILAPQQLPVGVITAFIGVPLFLYLLKSRQHG
jgi:iron complex transport system permease protein